MRSDIEAGRAYVTIAIRDKMTQALKAAEKRFQQFGRISARAMRTVGGGISDGMRGETAQILRINRSSEKSAAKVVSTLSKTANMGPIQNAGPGAVGGRARGNAAGGSGSAGLLDQSLAVKAAITGVGAAAVGWPLKLSADMEQTQTSFEVFLGSAERAKALIGDVEEMAAKTPFQFDELKDSAQLLMGFGATGEQVLPMMRMLGDVSGGNSERFQRLSLAFGQVMAKGRLMGQEVMQMTEQGFNPLQELSKLTGKSMKTLMDEMEKGNISFPMLVSAFQSATGPGGRFNGMMEKQSQTLNGLLSAFFDYSKMAARALGDSLLPVVKSLLTPAIALAKGFATIAKANAGLIGGIGKVVLIVGAVAGVFVGLGAAALGLSFVFGLIASGFAAIGSFLAVVFSPLGILISLLAGLAGVAYYFRDALSEAFQGLLVWISPVTEAFGRILWAGEGAVQGVVDALASGNIQLAGTIALAALRSMFWQAAHELPGAGRFLASSYGQAILAGRWDLLAAIAMTKVKLVLMQGWNGIANVWTAAITGLGALWDTIVAGIQTTWRTAVYGIASGILWVMEKLGLASAETQKQLEAMKQADQKSANAGYEKSMAARVASEQRVQAQRAANEQSLQQRIAQLQEEATKAAAESGVTTAAQAADKARAELDQALQTAKADREKAAEGNLPGNMVPGLAAKPAGLPKVESQGTFSAAAAMAFGSRSGAQEATARNTGMIAKLTQRLVDKPGAQFQ